MLKTSWSALFGFVAWALCVALLRPGWTATLFLFAPLTLVPLALGLLSATLGRPSGRAWNALLLLQPLAALLLVAAFALPVGPTAAAATLPWLLVTLLIALQGVREAWPVQGRSAATLAPAVGMMFLPIGGGWLVLSRLGARPLGFSDIIVLATAVHFHYAGFVLPILVGQVARALPGRPATLAAGGVIAGVPLVAAGITLSAFDVRWPEWLAAWLLVVSCFLTALLQLRVAAQQHRAPAALLSLSSLALLGGMVLAAVYALGSYCGIAWLSIEDMLPYHGAVNAFGFALCGLLGWRLALPENEPALPSADVLRWRRPHGHVNILRNA